MTDHSPATCTEVEICDTCTAWRQGLAHAMQDLASALTEGRDHRCHVAAGDCGGCRVAQLVVAQLAGQAVKEFAMGMVKLPDGEVARILDAHGFRSYMAHGQYAGAIAWAIKALEARIRAPR